MPKKTAKSGDPPPKHWPQIRMLRALSIAAEAFRESHRVFLEEGFGLSLSDFDVIATLGNTQGMRMKDIAAHMMTSSSASNVTRVCTGLEKKGLVERQRSPESDREVLARLTPKGQALFEEIFLRVAHFTRAFADSALPTTSDQEQVTELLRRFIDNAKAANQART